MRSFQRRTPRDILYFTGLYVASMRWLLTAAAPGHRPVSQRSRDRMDMLLIVLFAVSMAALPMLHAVTTLLDRWRYPLPKLLRQAGMAVYALALALMWRAYRDLGMNWAPVTETGRSQTLVTSGVYRGIRHPIYAAYLLWSTAMPLMIPNIAAGFAMPVVTILLCLRRIPIEEHRLLETYGDEYRRYRHRTASLLPMPRHFAPRARTSG
ncbi:MAG: hypothetical protein GF331_19880 [Chitinivibrionales bacterium]|nr:hypothetical protein [Chitinivibrionales bacterium]